MSLCSQTQPEAQNFLKLPSRKTKISSNSRKISSNHRGDQGTSLLSVIFMFFLNEIYCKVKLQSEMNGIEITDATVTMLAAINRHTICLICFQFVGRHGMLLCLLLNTIGNVSGHQFSIPRLRKNYFRLFQPLLNTQVNFCTSSPSTRFFFN